jgi:triosephosphate isomerase (TIM)
MNNISKKLIAGNWKMSLDYEKSLLLSKSLAKLSKKKKNINEALILPDYISLSDVIRNLKGKGFKFGSQNVSFFDLGAYTGEVSLQSLAQAGCNYVLIGHSERRQYFNDRKFISKKIKNVLENSGLTPILCVGESWNEKKSGKTISVIKKQIKEAFSDVKSLRSKKVIIAYEPIWAIGSGKTVKVEEAEFVHGKIRDFVFEIFKSKSPEELGVIYGGSVNVKNYKEFKDNKNISGLLIGGASLKPNDFIEIINNF